MPQPPTQRVTPRTARPIARTVHMVVAEYPAAATPPILLVSRWSLCDGVEKSAEALAIGSTAGWAAGWARLPGASPASSLSSKGEGTAGYRSGPEEPVRLRRLGRLSDASESAETEPPSSTAPTSPPLRRPGPRGAQSAAEVAPGVVGEELDGVVGQELLSGHLICGSRPRPRNFDGNHDVEGSLRLQLKFSGLSHLFS